jgi:tetratricopeptide (TPR) repeat protein
MANNIGVELFRRGEVIRAEPLFIKATENNPKWDVAWSNLGACAQRQMQYDRALELYGKAVSMGTYYLAYENYAGLICSKNRDEKCRNFLVRAHEIFPNNSTFFP